MNMSIGRLSKKTGVNIETICYYERIKLLQKPIRTEGGHRIYADGDKRRLIFIRRSRELGFSIDDIRDLLGLVDGGGLTCAEVKSITESHLASVSRRLTDLKKIKKILRIMVQDCSGDTVPECSIIDILTA
jgi:MerR family mercuric resistance operon transcriptional regulator